MEETRTYRQLIVWKKAMALAEAAYQLTERFPASERFGLRMQLRRSAVSVPSNIAEGQGRRSEGEFLQFLSIAYGSLRELETQTELSIRLGFLDHADGRTLLTAAGEVGRLLNGLTRSLAGSRTPPPRTAN